MSLRTKLILTFLVISVAGTVIAAIIVSRSNERAFDELLQEQARANFMQDVRIYYQVNGSWEGVIRTVMDRNPGHRDEFEQRDGGESPQRPSPPPFALADAAGFIHIPGGPYERGQVVSAETLAQGTPVLVDDAVVGTVLTIDQTLLRNSAEDEYVARTNRALVIGALGATAAAVVLALVMARTLTRPLQELAAASRAMAKGELAQEVPVRTQDELGALAAAFNQMSADLDRANKQRRQLTADIAHDLRTPLTVLAGYLEAMEDGTLRPTSGRLNMMQQEVNVLLRLVEDLRTLSLADAGNLTLHKEETAVADLLAQVQAAFAYHAEQQDVMIAVETAPDLPDILIDPGRIRQAVDNLVSNALRYTPARGVITLAADGGGNGRMRLRVADTGSGIPSADLPHIFDRFYRGDKARQEGQGESGLGLAIVKSVIHAHGGEIAVDSTLGQGTVFTIWLPLGS